MPNPLHSMLLVLAGALLILTGYVQEFIRLWRIPRLSGSGTTHTQQPFVSLVIPARNEAGVIGRCLDGALTQTYPHYEVVVVDDASTDATPAIVARYQQQHTHLRVIQGVPLPTGWTGKAYACQQGAQTARGEWLLFLDADTAPAPTLVAALLAHTEQQQYDLLTLFPLLELESFWERTILPAFRSIIYATYPFARWNAPGARCRDVAGNGQCMFIRRAAYGAVNGHYAVRAAVLEDVALAQAICAAGYRVGAAEDQQHIRVRMYTSGAEVLAGLTKNAAAGYRAGGHRSFLVGMRLFVLTLAPLWLLLGGVALRRNNALAAGTAALGSGSGLSLLALLYWAALMQRLYRLPWWYAPLWPVGLHCYGIIVLWSAWRVSRRRGVVWKGRTYVGT